jgi:CHASE3 domain sensor protein
MINSSLIPLIQNKLVDLNETINLREHQGFNAALQVVLSDKGKRITDDIRTDITNMENEENNLLANRAKQLEAVGNNTIYTITIGILIASSKNTIRPFRHKNIVSNLFIHILAYDIFYTQYSST